MFTCRSGTQYVNFLRRSAIKRDLQDLGRSMEDGAIYQEARGINITILPRGLMDKFLNRYLRDNNVHIKRRNVFMKDTFQNFTVLWYRKRPITKDKLNTALTRNRLQRILLMTNVEAKNFKGMVTRTIKISVNPSIALVKLPMPTNFKDNNNGLRRNNFH